MAAETKAKDWIVDIEHLTSLEDIQDALSRVRLAESEVETRLVDLVSTQPDLEKEMRKIQTKIPAIETLEHSSRNLTGMISSTARLADRVSGRVRRLDDAKRRVGETKKRVDDLLVLKSCSHDVNSALKRDDYEQAAMHIHSFLNLDKSVLTVDNEGEGDSLASRETSYNTLNEAKEKLQKTIRTKFDQAVHSGDTPSVERFFKIFPRLGLHDEGILKFGKFVAAQISSTADLNFNNSLQNGGETTKRSHVQFADLLTLLFESIAQAVEARQPLIETYYGPGKIFALFKLLQAECDRQSRKILDRFKSSRAFLAKARMAQSALLTRSFANNDSPIDAKELDLLLSEVILLNTRTEVYWRFLKMRLEQDVQEQQQQQDLIDALKVDMIDKSDLCRTMQEVMGHYVLMEEYFMRISVAKAETLDSVDDDAQLTSSMVDDVFFIIKKCLRRSLSSGSADVTGAMLNQTCAILESEYFDILKTRLNNAAGFAAWGSLDLTQAYSLVQSSFQQGKIQSAKDSERDKALFLSALNNAEVSSDYIQTLCKSFEDECQRTALTREWRQQSLAKVEACLSNLCDISKGFQELIELGHNQLRVNVLKPRVKPFVDNFAAFSHDISEEEFANYEANDPWVQALIVCVDSLLASFKESLTSNNYDGLVAQLTAEIVVRLEKAVSKSTFNRLGGLQFDKELRSLVTYLSSTTNWTIRDKFAKITQTASILNLEVPSEMEELWGGGAVGSWSRWNKHEIKNVMNLRADFRAEDIHNVIRRL